ncbi:MAG: S9 family peptidase [Actinomycetota bacterium]|nr:MAG: S9 family peptidase [Actinomycetota bacterium]
MTRPDYPAAPRLDLVDDRHGRAVPDPYRWLESPADTAGPSAVDPEWTQWRATWAQQQAALLSAEQAAWTSRDRFAGRVQQLLGAGHESPPYWRGDRRFLTRRAPDQQFAVLLTVDPDGTERVLLDPMSLDPTGLTTLDSWQPSKEGDLLAYQLSQGGTEESVLWVMDVRTGAVVDGPIDRARYSPVAWLPGGEAFYYVRRLPPELLPDGEKQFHRRVWLHRVGTPAESDAEIFGDGLTVTNYYGVSVSRDGRWLVVSVSEGTAPRNDLYVADLAASAPQAPAFTVVQEGVDAQTGLHVGRDGRFYVFSDRDAPRGALYVADSDDPSVAGWTVLLPEDDEAVLDGFTVLDGDELAAPRLIASWTRHTVTELTVHDLHTGERLGDIALPGLGTVAGPVERPEGGPECWFVYTDHTTVPHVYRYDGRSDEVSLWASPPGTVDVPTVHTRLVTYHSADGTPVRMFVLSGTGEPDRPRPTILYGYGGFGVPMGPGYSATILAWVEAGGVYAVANLRGGGEEGEAWHRDGMLDRKQNVFDDFHAAAEFLIAEGWTTREQLAVNGGSNGGLLVGAALTQRPDLYQAVICVAPLLDMVRYTTSALGQTWTVEYGDPDVPAELDWLLAYSPYHQVRPGVDYPATMFMVFDNDTRTDPMHGRKMCAALQAATSGSRPVVIRAEAEVGHGARSLSRSVDESADMLAFAARWTGLEPGA